MSSVLALLIPVSLFMAFFFVMIFLWATKKGRHGDLNTPENRKLKDNKQKETT